MLRKLFNKLKVQNSHLSNLMKSSFLGELQNQLDTWCQNLGTDDDVVIPGENADCNDKRYARHDGERWRCWTDVVLDANSYSCVSDDKSLVKCGSKGSGDRCTRNDEILKLIHDFTSDKIGKECLNINIQRVSQFRFHLTLSEPQIY